MSNKSSKSIVCDTRILHLYTQAMSESQEVMQNHHKKKHIHIMQLPLVPVTNFSFFVRLISFH